MPFVSRIVDWYFSKRALPYWCVLMLDLFVCFLSGIAVFMFYSRGMIPFEKHPLVLKTVLVYTAFTLIGFRAFRTYSGIIRYSSFVDLRKVLYAMLLSCAVAEVFHYWAYHSSLDIARLQGRQIFLIYAVSALGMSLVRVFVKSAYDITFGKGGAANTLIYGAREGAVGIAKAIRNEKPMKFNLKGFVSSSNTSCGHIISGVEVYPCDKTLAGVIADKGVKALLVSPLQNDAFRKDEQLQEMLLASGVKIYMSPKLVEWNADSDYSDVGLKEINIGDLLPRSQIQVDMDAIGSQLTGKRILVTGSAGSIGSEIVRQICAYAPGELMLIDQAETPQHDVRLMMKNQWPGIKATTVVGSICNRERMEEIFRSFRPYYVFHAAAYKHVPMMEDNPSESVQNNIYGTQVVADLSVKYGVEKFVMLSTDKAVNPSNVMGCSKRICEIYVQSLDKAVKDGKVEGRTQFVTTRFGNVLGSNGSVIPIFEEQIRKGGPVTVTHPDIIRYFMLISEACKLVLEAGTHGKGGEIFVFEMGQPVKIASLAKRMISLSGVRGVEIVYSGLRDGEKLYEELISNDENTKPSFNKMIRIALVREYDYSQVCKDLEELYALAHTYDGMKIVAKMKAMVPEYTSLHSVFSSLDKN